MVGDLGLLLRLRARHARTMLSRMMHFAGADPVFDKRWDDRAYQFYIGAAVAVALALLWAALLDTVATVFATSEVTLSITIFHGGILLPVAVFFVSAIKGLRASPLKFTHQDISYIASSCIGTRPIVMVDVAVKALVGVAVGGLAGWLFGTAIESGIAGISAAAPTGAWFGALSCAAAIGGAWMFGLIRLSVRRFTWQHRVACGLALGAFSIALAAASLLIAPTDFFNGNLHVAICAGLIVAIMGEAVLIGAIAPRANMTAAIEESALYADLQPFSGLSPLDPNTVREYRRRRKLAGRKLRFCMPAWSGRMTLLAHASVSLVRRYDGLGSLILQGVVVVPMGVMALLGIGGPVMLLFWLQAVVMVPYGVRESTRVFRDDMRNRLVRDRLPFGTLELLAWDSLPAFAVTSVICLAVSALVASAIGASVVCAVIYALLVNAALVLCGGLDAVRLFERTGRLCYEMGAVVLVAVVGACLVTSTPVIAVVGVIAVCIAVGSAIRFGRECIG